MFGLTATLCAHVLAQAAYQRLDHAAWANLLLWPVLALAGLLAATDTPYPRYFSGAQFIHFLLGPAVVALGWPLWQRRAQLRQRGVALLAAALAVITGLVGAISGSCLFDRLGIRGHDLRGFALGTTSHGIGAARAMQVHPDAGAYAGLALGLQVVLASLLMPLLAPLITRWLGG